MNTDTLAFENDEQRRRAVAWVVALASTFPVAAQRAEPMQSLGPTGQPASREEMPATSVYQVLYRSTVTKPLTNQELLDLLEQARSFNLEHQITGMLLYSEGQFVQAIEGREEVIRPLYERIQRDSRHREIETVGEGRLPAHQFSEWSMDFGYACEADGTTPPLPLPGLSTTSAHLKRLLEAFIG